MHPSAQKLDIDRVSRELQSYIKQLEQSVAILKKGMDYIDEGGNILADRGLLPEEVRRIMKNPINEI